MELAMKGFITTHMKREELGSTKQDFSPIIQYVQSGWALDIIVSPRALHSSP